MTITITEALAEIPTIQKRIAKKQEFINNFLFRQSAVRDPHEADGSSSVLIARELQSITDLVERQIKIRAAIQSANAANTIVIGDQTRSITDWLTWRREVAPVLKGLFDSMDRKLGEMRRVAAQQGVSVSEKDMGFSKDFVVHVNERELAATREGLEQALGELDGKLSLKNATITLDI